MCALDAVRWSVGVHFLQRQKERAVELFEIVALRSAVLPPTFGLEALGGKVLAMDSENSEEAIALLDESLDRLAHTTLEGSIAWAVGAVALARLLLSLGPGAARFWEAEAMLVRARNALTRNSGVRCLFWLETFKLLALFHDTAGRFGRSFACERVPPYTLPR